MCGAGESSKEAAMKEIKPPNLALEKIRSVIRKVRLEVDEEKYFLTQNIFRRARQTSTRTDQLYPPPAEVTTPQPPPRPPTTPPPLVTELRPPPPPPRATARPPRTLSPTTGRPRRR